MQEVLDVLLQELVEKNGGSLELDKHHYFLFLQDGVLDIYFDENEKGIKAEVQLT